MLPNGQVRAVCTHASPLLILTVRSRGADLEAAASAALLRVQDPDRSKHAAEPSGAFSRKALSGSWRARSLVSCAGQYGGSPDEQPAEGSAASLLAVVAHHFSPAAQGTLCIVERRVYAFLNQSRAAGIHGRGWISSGRRRAGAVSAGGDQAGEHQQPAMIAASVIANAAVPAGVHSCAGPRAAAVFRQRQHRPPLSLPGERYAGKNAWHRAPYLATWSLTPAHRVSAYARSGRCARLLTTTAGITRAASRAFRSTRRSCCARRFRRTSAAR